MKKYMKRICVLMVCCSMMVIALAGCGSKGNEKDASTPIPDNGATENMESSSEMQTGGWDGEVSKIIMTFPTTGVEPADLSLVQDAINEISVERIGVEVEFKPLSIFEISSQCPMWIGAGEQIDLMCVAFTGLQTYIEQGMIAPMQWMEEAPYLQELAAEQPVFDTTGADGVYGIMTITSPMGYGGGYLISVEDLEAAGFSYQDGDKITLDDLDVIFEKIKEVNPDAYPCGVTGSMGRAGMTFVSDALGATAASGSLIGLDSKEVVNYFASEEYKTYLEHVRSWYEKGYVLKDAATTDISLTELVRDGKVSGYFSEGSANLRNVLELNTGREYIHLMFNDPYIPAVSAANNSYWTIPVTNKEPEAAMRFLNLMYEEPAITNTFVWGVEGRHYEVLDEEQGVIGYPEGITQENNGYAYGIGLYGQHVNSYVMLQSTKEEDAKWNETALKRKSSGYGFCYDSSAMTNQIIAISAVITEFQPALETGSADLESTYQEFITKLESNGINEVIADKQAQFDAWIANQGD